MSSTSGGEVRLYKFNSPRAGLRLVTAAILDDEIRASEAGPLSCGLNYRGTKKDHVAGPDVLPGKDGAGVLGSESSLTGERIEASRKAAMASPKGVPPVRSDAGVGALRIFAISFRGTTSWTSCQSLAQGVSEVMEMKSDKKRGFPGRRRWGVCCQHRAPRSLFSSGGQRRAREAPRAGIGPVPGQDRNKYATRGYARTAARSFQGSCVKPARDQKERRRTRAPSLRSQTEVTLRQADLDGCVGRLFAVVLFKPQPEFAD